MLNLFDGDVVAHIAAAIPFRARIAEFDKLGIPTDNYKGRSLSFYCPQNDPKTFAQCKDNFWQLVQESNQKVWASDFLMAVKSPTNFRDDMYPLYKAKRGKWNITNPWVPILRDWAVSEGLALHAHDKEADDYLRIWAEQCRLEKIPFVVSSVDKDLYCIEGKHLDLKQKKILAVDRLEALRNFYSQLLSGDQVDHIPGLPGVGPKTAVKMVAACTTEEEFQEIVVAHYYEAYGDQWDDYLLSNGKMLYIMKTENDYFRISHWPLAKELR